MLHGFGFSRRTYAEPGGRVCSFILAEVERDQRDRAVLRRSWAELDGSGAPDSGLWGVAGWRNGSVRPKADISLLLLLGRRFPSPIEAEISLNPLSEFAEPLLSATCRIPPHLVAQPMTGSLEKHFYCFEPAGTENHVGVQEA